MLIYNYFIVFFLFNNKNNTILLQLILPEAAGLTIHVLALQV